MQEVLWDGGVVLGFALIWWAPQALEFLAIGLMWAFPAKS